MGFLSTRSRTTKIVVVILIVAFASATVAISYYATTKLLSKNISPTLTPSPEPTVSLTPAPTPVITPTSTPITTSTPTSAANQTPTPSPLELTAQEKIRDSAMYHIKSKHPETAQFMTDLFWTGGRVTPSNIVGAETYMYYSHGWNVTISYPVVPNAIYNITADYSSTSVSIPYRIIWQGTWQNETIKEISYVFAQ